jgi:predicted DNA-binding transcriptional regulator AlpA
VKNPQTKKSKAVTPKPRVPQTELLPDYFYRVHQGSKFFGYSNTVLHLKIESGEIPAPIALSDRGRARGWFGRTIIKWQAEREAKPAVKLVVGKAGA